MTLKPLRLRIGAAQRSFLTSDLALVWAVVFVAWGLILLATITGQDHLLSHSAWNNSLPLPLRLLIFLGAWQVMIAAMMLPSTLPMVRLFVQASQAQPRLSLIIFLAAYAAIWTGFALIFLIGEYGWQWLSWRSHWLHQRPWLISGLTLLLAGGFQFTPFKEQCLQVCRHPFSFLTHHYQRGLKAAWNLDIHHGLYCLGCCWALMLVMFAVGTGHLTCAIALTGVMTLERTGNQGQAIAPIVGIVLMTWGILVLLQPDRILDFGFL